MQSFVPCCPNIKHTGATITLVLQPTSTYVCPHNNLMAQTYLHHDNHATINYNHFEYYIRKCYTSSNKTEAIKLTQHPTTRPNGQNANLSDDNHMHEPRFLESKQEPP